MKTIMTNKNTNELNRTRFIESLDQVRFDPNNKDGNKIALGVTQLNEKSTTYEYF